MKNFAILFVVTLALAVSSLGQKAAAGTGKTDPAKGVRDAFDRLIEGIEQIDAGKVMSVYENGPRTLFFNNNGSNTLGWATMSDNRKSLYAKTKNVSIETDGVRVEMLGKMAAYVSCTWKQSQEYEGKLETAAGRMTLIFKLIGKDWKVVHAHTSPSVPAANRPVLDSERLKDPVVSDVNKKPLNN
jgi:ketosteroid isomerase-like protein